VNTIAFTSFLPICFDTLVSCGAARTPDFFLRRRPGAAAQHDDPQPYPPYDETQPKNGPQVFESRDNREEARYTEYVAASISAATPPIFCKSFIIYLLYPSRQQKSASAVAGFIVTIRASLESSLYPIITHRGEWTFFDAYAAPKVCK
jgi:hypothetical protein